MKAFLVSLFLLKIIPNIATSQNNKDEILEANFLMKSTSYCPFEHYQKANSIYETKYGISSPKFLESMRLVANTKLRKYEYDDNIELYRIDTRSFSQVPDISASTNDRTGLNYEEISSFYSFIEEKLKERYQNKGYYES